MRPVIFGTAGHIDHGKTTLTVALTGIDTDRLPEEKARGISIDLGFAHFRLPSGRQAAIVDVPGHERFVRNMVAGVHGMDAVLLVIAADEGVMPQTREHLDILELLGVQRGLVVLSKSDTVEADWLDLVEETVRESLAQSFLASAPILRVDSLSGRGIGDLLAAMDRLVEQVPPRDADGFVRMPIDRVFSVRGFGTVVTGTLVGGRIRVEDGLALVPGDTPVRVRGLQVHNRPVEQAEAGQRVAANLSGVERDAVRRGMVLATPGTLAAQSRVVVRLTVLPSGPEIVRRTRVHLHSGTAEALARIMPYAGRLMPGQTDFAEIELEEPLALAAGDRFLVRSYSPVTTIGGGQILEVGVHYHPRRPDLRGRLERLNQLAARPSDYRARVAWVLTSVGRPLSGEELSRQVGLPAGVLERLAKDDVPFLRTGDGRWWLDRGTLAAVAERAGAAVAAYHREYPLRPGMPWEEFRRGVAPDWDARALEAVLAEGLLGGLMRERDAVRAADFALRLEPAQERALAWLWELVDAAGLKPEPMAAIRERVAQETGLAAATVRDLEALLVRDGRLVRLEEGLFLSDRRYREAEQAVRRALADGPRTTSELREALGTNRRFAVPILELMDQRRVTRRAGETRQLASDGGGARTSN